MKSEDITKEILKRFKEDGLPQNSMTEIELKRANEIIKEVIDRYEKEKKRRGNVDIQKDIPMSIFEEVEPVVGVLYTVEDCFYESGLGNMSLHLLTTEQEDNYYIQRFTADGTDWFKCIDIERLKELL